MANGIIQFLQAVEKNNEDRVAALKRQAQIMEEFVWASRAGDGVRCQNCRDRLHVEVDTALDAVSGVHALARKHGLSLPE